MSFQKGNVPWNKGLKNCYSKEASSKMGFVKGYIPWNKGLKCPIISEKLTGRKESEEIRKKKSESHKGLKHKEETKLKIGLKGEKHPLFGKTGSESPFFGKNHTEETKQKMSDLRCNKYNGRDNPNWRGGISLEPYCIEFTKDFKEEIKERDDYQCKNPKCNGNFDRLIVHHVNYDKKDCDWYNLITLCNSCNSKANFNRGCWQSLYINIMEEMLWKTSINFQS